MSAHAEGPPSLASTYKTRADQLIGAAMVDDEGYANLAWLCDHIGKRVSGSEPLERGDRVGGGPDASRRLVQRRAAAGEGSALGAVARNRLPSSRL